MSSRTKPDPQDPCRGSLGAEAPVPLAGLLLRAFTWFDVRLLESLSSRGFAELTRSQALLFAHLREGSRTSGLARRAGVSRQAVHQTVKELERMGLVTQIVDPTNASAKLVVRTREGDRVREAALETFEELERELAQRIGVKNLDALRRALEQDWE